MSEHSEHSEHAETITPATLRGWPLPTPSGSKYARGQVLVIGGAAMSPGAVMLAGLASLRVGAGKLTLAVAESVASPVAVAVPEAGVIALPETSSGSVRGDRHPALEQAAGRADAVVVGPGLDDVDETARLLEGVREAVEDRCSVVLDAYALGALPRLDTPFASRLALTPNHIEAETLLDTSLDEITGQAALDIAERYRAVVTAGQWVAADDGRLWRDSTGHPGLGTSGSGDVLAGAVGGLMARGASPEQAACWGSHLHAAAGDRLAAGVGRLGFLARELVDMLPRVLVEISETSS
jgi:ADP-dependent NAD(P)H-hydrate dehydratase